MLPVAADEEEAVDVLDEVAVLSVEDLVSDFVSVLLSDFVSDFPPSLVDLPSLNLSE